MNVPYLKCTCCRPLIAVMSFVVDWSAISKGQEENECNLPNCFSKILHQAATPCLLALEDFCKSDLGQESSSSRFAPGNLQNRDTANVMHEVSLDDLCDVTACFILKVLSASCMEKTPVNFCAVDQNAECLDHFHSKSAGCHEECIPSSHLEET